MLIRYSCHSLVRDLSAKGVGIYPSKVFFYREGGSGDPPPFSLLRVASLEVKGGGLIAKKKGIISFFFS